jgi:hypothetical protein
MALTAEEQELLDFALAALPPWFSDDEGRDFAIEAAHAKMMGAARAQTAYWFGQTLISTATGATATTPDWLEQHAKDRGTRRQDGESDAALRSRLRTFSDALTVEAVMDAAQQVIDAAGVIGDVHMLELRRDRAYLGKNGPQSGTGGTFTAQAGNLHSFAPTAGWARPPLVGLQPNITWKLVIGAAASGGNDGTFTITALDEDRAVYTNATGAAGLDATATWRIDRYDAAGNLLTAGTGRQDAYLSRGHRMGAQYSTILLILPYGTDEATAEGVAEAVRQRKAAGVRVLIERRLNP